MKERPPTNSEQVVVGVTHPNFDGEVFIGRNFKPEEIVLETAFLSTDCHPILRARIKYMSFIRNSVLDPLTGSIKNQILLDRLLDIDDVSKFSRAGRAGYHGEIRALSDALYKLETVENLPRGSLPESRMMEFDMFIRNGSDKVMQRCPNCFQIGNVKVLGGR